MAPDETGAIISILKEGLEKADIVATIGGVSLGEKDHVLDAIKQIGKAKVVIRGIKVQPGRVTMVSLS